MMVSRNFFGASAPISLDLIIGRAETGVIFRDISLLFSGYSEETSPTVRFMSESTTVPSQPHQPASKQLYFKYNFCQFSFTKTEMDSHFKMLGSRMCAGQAKIKATSQLQTGTPVLSAKPRRQHHSDAYSKRTPVGGFDYGNLILML
jgi:hypothetical protein